MTNAEYEDMRGLYLQANKGAIEDLLRKEKRYFTDSYRKDYCDTSMRAEIYVIPGLISFLLWYGFSEKSGKDAVTAAIVAIMGCAAWFHYLILRRHNRIVDDFFDRDERRVVIVRYMMNSRQEMIAAAKSQEEAERIADFFEIALQDIPRNTLFKYE